MFNTGFDPKDLDQYVNYLRQIIDMIINLFKALAGKKDDAADNGDANDSAAG